MRPAIDVERPSNRHSLFVRRISRGDHFTDCEKLRADKRA